MEHTEGYQALLKTGKFTFILPQFTLNVVLLYFLLVFIYSVKHSVMRSVKCALQL